MASKKIKIKNVLSGRSYQVTERGWESILSNPEVSNNYIVVEPIKPAEPAQDKES